MVVSSTATMPARAPASMDILQTVMRPSRLRERIALPANSMAWPVPPAVPITPMMCSTTSLAVTPGPSSPSTCTRMFFILLATRVWVASTCSTSLVPMPWARQASAPLVEVWESPHTTVMPGSTAPCSGAITCTMPWRTSPMPYSVMPNSRVLSCRVVTWMREVSSSMSAALSNGVVGTLWSMVATEAPARHGCRPARRRPSNACGEVTSWMICRSM